METKRKNLTHPPHTVYVESPLWKELSGLLRGKGTTISGWFREKAEEEIGKNPPNSLVVGQNE